MNIQVLSLSIFRKPEGQLDVHANFLIGKINGAKQFTASPDETVEKLYARALTLIEADVTA